MTRKLIFDSVLVVLLIGFQIVNAQDPNRFKYQLDELLNKEYNFNTNKKSCGFNWKFIHPILGRCSVLFS